MQVSSQNSLSHSMVAVFEETQFNTEVGDTANDNAVILLILKI